MKTVKELEKELADARLKEMELAKQIKELQEEEDARVFPTRETLLKVIPSNGSYYFDHAYEHGFVIETVDRIPTINSIYDVSSDETRVIFKVTKEGKETTYWSVVVTSSSYADEDYIDKYSLVQVEPQEVTKIEWVKVK